MVGQDDRRIAVVALADDLEARSSSRRRTSARTSTESSTRTTDGGRPPGTAFTRPPYPDSTRLMFQGVAAGVEDARSGLLASADPGTRPAVGDVPRFPDDGAVAAEACAAPGGGTPGASRERAHDDNEWGLRAILFMCPHCCAPPTGPVRRRHRGRGAAGGRPGPVGVPRGGRDRGRLAGQLTIGWGNDLVDATRDRQVGRTDKPLANDELRASTVRACLLVAALACVVLSLAVGWRSGLVHLGLGVACGHLYNLVLKSTPWSWLPYAVAFGTLPAVVTLADVPHRWPPLWMMGAAAALGVAAHFLNTLPDLAADATTGVRGLPHRIGAGRSRRSPPRCWSPPPWRQPSGPAGTPGARGVGGARAGGGPRRRRLARPWSDAVPGGDGDRPGRRRADHGGRHMTTWDLAIVGAGPAGAAAAIGALGVDPSLRVALLDRCDVPARQVLRRRHRPAGHRPAGRGGSPVGRRGPAGGAAAAPAPRRPGRRPPDGAEHLGDPAHGVRPPPGDRRADCRSRAPARAGARGARGRPRGAWTSGTRRASSIGADGAHSVVRRALGLRPGPMAVALRGYAPTPPARAGAQVIVFDTARQPAYAWSFDRGDGAQQRRVRRAARPAGRAD